MVGGIRRMSPNVLAALMMMPEIPIVPIDEAKATELRKQREAEIVFGKEPEPVLSHIAALQTVARHRSPGEHAAMVSAEAKRARKNARRAASLAPATETSGA